MGQSNSYRQHQARVVTPDMPEQQKSADKPFSARAVTTLSKCENPHTNLPNVAVTSQTQGDWKGPFNLPCRP